MRKATNMTDESELERQFTVKEVAANRRVVPRTVRNWIKFHGLRATTVGRLIRISQTALNDFDRNH